MATHPDVDLRLLRSFTVLAEELNSYLLPSERIDWKKIVSGGGSKAA